MTDEQYKRWVQFSMRMAVHCFNDCTPERRRKIIKNVAHFFKWRIYQKDWHKIRDWDGNKDEYYLADCVRDFYEEYLHYSRKEECYTGKFFEQVVSCIRAGFDVAVEPSAGVIGFTVGDVRRMWENNVPEWVSNGFFDSQGKPVDFASLKDDTLLWL